MKVRAEKAGTRSPFIQIAVGVAIVAVVWIVFGQTLGHDFLNYDDKTYVYGNSLVSAGLSPHGCVRAFTDTQTNNWHPLTLVSHMIDCQIFDLEPGGHHFTNVLLHAIAALLLLIWLTQVTGNFWGAAFVAALFAIHPLRVESVAWIAERKDVLSAVFFFLTLIAYARYARASSFARYFTVSILFACGLMAKPMLVTTPVVLLLLDYWPLKRFTNAKSFWHVAMEKVPLLVLSAAASIIALRLQVHSPTSVSQLPFLWRLENALVSYVIYVWQLFWPANLAVFYPHPDDRLAWWQITLAAIFLIVTTWIAFKLRRNRPYLLVGWLWYLIMLLPVIGIIEVGLQGHADRYPYLPHVGLAIALTWSIVDLSATWTRRKAILATAGTIVVVALSFWAWQQTRYWRDSETLWRHTLAVTTDNDVANTNLGMVLSDHGQFEEALSHLQTALVLRSRREHRHYDLSRAIILDDIGEVLVHKGDLDQAIPYFRQSLDARPDYSYSRYNLGTTLFQKGDVDGAIAEWQKVLSFQPGDTETLTNIGNAFALKHMLGEAIQHYEKAIQSDPESERASNNLAWILSTAPDASFRNGVRAVELAKNATQISRNPLYIRTLAAAYAEAAQFEAAVQTASRAAETADAQGQRDLAAQIREEMNLYRRHLPLRDESLTNAPKTL